MPREIRDWIYGYLLDRLDECGRVWPLNWRFKPFLYEDGDIVGANIAQELMETYYRRAEFGFQIQKDTSLDTFLQMDPFGYELPICDNICFLHLSLRAFGNVAKSRGRRVKKALEPLLRIRGNCEIALSFTIQNAPIQILHFVERLNPLISELREKRCIVKLWFDKGNVFSYKPYAWRISTAEHDLVKILSVRLPHLS